MSKKRLALICSTDYRNYPFGGMLSFILDIIPYFKKDFDITLWGVSTDTDIKEDEIIAGGERFPLKIYSNIKTNKKFVPNLVRVVCNISTKVEKILSESYDVIYFHGIPLSYPFLKLKHRRQLPKLVNHVHGLTNPFSVARSKTVNNPIMLFIYEKYRTWVVKKSDLILLAADFKGYEDFLSRYNSAESKKKILHIPNFADDRLFFKRDKLDVREKLGISPDDKIFINVSRLSPQKDPFLLVNSFTYLKKEPIADAKLVIIGDGELRKDLKRQIMANRLSSSVLLTGKLERDVIALWLNAADVYVYTSHGNGFPIALIEAALCGLPIVTTDVAGVHDIVIEDQTGYLVSVRDPREIAKKMVFALKDHERLSANILERAKGFTPEMIASKISNAINSLF